MYIVLIQDHIKMELYCVELKTGKEIYIKAKEKIKTKGKEKSKD